MWNSQGKLKRGYPKYWIMEKTVPKRKYLQAAKSDQTLPVFREQDNSPQHRAAERGSPCGAQTDPRLGPRRLREDIAALENRTEGWIAGLQLAAISMQGHKVASGFIKSFTGSHYFVMDYLVEEVLQQPSESVQTFLLRTSILDRLCGPLCDAVVLNPSASGQETLEYLERANLFIIPLDNERRWYRYHHLFVDLLRYLEKGHARGKVIITVEYNNRS